jgi:hypothetical protein
VIKRFLICDRDHNHSKSCNGIPPDNLLGLQRNDAPR